MKNDFGTTVIPSLKFDLGLCFRFWVSVRTQEWYTVNISDSNVNSTNCIMIRIELNHPISILQTINSLTKDFI